jgi:hypothetical protein
VDGTTVSRGGLRGYIATGCKAVDVILLGIKDGAINVLFGLGNL